MLIIVLSAPTEPNLNALAWNMTSVKTKMQASVIGSICTYSMICDADFQKHPRSSLNEFASQIWNQLKKFCFIYCINGAFLMNIARKCVK